MRIDTTSELERGIPRLQARRNVELETRVALFLFQKGNADIEDLRVEACGNTVKVTGKIQSQLQGTRCVAACRRVAGVTHVVDGLELS